MEKSSMQDLDASILSNSQKDVELDVDKKPDKKTVKFRASVTSKISSAEEKKPKIERSYTRQQSQKRRQTAAFLNKATIYFGPDKTHENFEIQNYTFGLNRISTTKYNVLTWFPKSLLMQFKRLANIYFLLISILTTLDLSPKSPYSQVITFAIVLLFTMVKEAVEDVRRYKNDNEINNKYTNIFDYTTKQFVRKFWYEIRVGDLVKISKDEPFPADILMVKSSAPSGLCFVDTKDLDGETYLKEKIVNPDFKDLTEEEIYSLDGSTKMDQPNEYMDSWEGNVFYSLLRDGQEEKMCSNMSIKQLLLKGSILKNTQFIIGFVVYNGHNTKIMKNAKNPPIKMSNVMRIMNTLLISVFFFEFIICFLFSALNYVFRVENNKDIETYIEINQKITAYSLLEKFFVFLVDYSHVIPISLYTTLECVKLLQTWFVLYDDLMFDPDTNKPSQAKTSELVEELGQVQFIFSDKTGTLTQNVMEFKKCLIGDRIYGDSWEENDEDDASSISNRFEVESNASSHRDEKAKYSINGDTYGYRTLSTSPQNFSEILKYQDENEKKKLLEFFMVCSVCHSGIVDNDEHGEIKYSSSSPDEIALINGAKSMGFTFMTRTTDTIEVYNAYTGKLDVWEVLVELPFDSFRKRMSLIVKNRDDKDMNIFILSKGADSIMLPRCNIDGQKKTETIDALYRFSCEGLRTLVLAMKVIPYTNFKKWHENYKKAMIVNEPEEKQTTLNELYEKIERELNVVGVTAIEDKLQEGVPETIELLLKSGIRMWVLTGDKKETALIIGRTCRLIEEIGSNCVDLTIEAIGSNVAFDQYKVKLEEKLDQLIKTFRIGHITNYDDLMKVDLDENFYMITDGLMLIEILKNPKISEKFFKIGILCRSVICCRVSPKQKSQIVTMTKSLGNWVTLSVGDGANDVPMIMEAHIGVGIQGKEGTQAVRSADYAICQFRFLQRLLLVHGRNGYRRISAFICYYFYKNIILVFGELYFVFISGYSGQLFFPDILSILYNSLWTSWPCIFSFAVEKDIIEDKPKELNKMKYKYNLLGTNFEIIPTFYSAGQNGVFFNMKVFWKWMFYAVVHGVLSYVLVYVGLRFQSISLDGKLVDHWWAATLIFTVLLHVTTYKILIEVNFWNFVVFLTSFSAIGLYYASIYLLNFPIVSEYVAEEITLKVEDMLYNKNHWLFVVTIPVIILLIDLGCKFLSRFSNPTPFDIFDLFKYKTGKVDVDIVKKISTIFNPRDVYMNRKSGISTHAKKSLKQGQILFEQKDSQEGEVEMRNF